jgi:hypothetical protein
VDQNPPGFANEDEEATYCLSLLRDGDRQQKIVARERLSQIFEQRGLLDEAAQCLESNIREGIRDPRVYQRLAGVYKAATSWPTRCSSKRAASPTGSSEDSSRAVAVVPPAAQCVVARRPRSALRTSRPASCRSRARSIPRRCSRRLTHELAVARVASWPSIGQATLAARPRADRQRVRPQARGLRPR